jgi:mannosyltransferase OCH1-like enzyme
MILHMKGWWQLGKPISSIAPVTPISVLKDDSQPAVSDVVPRVIYQTWESHEMPTRMMAAGAALREANPGFEHRLFDAPERRAFLVEYFSEAVVAAYDTLVPNAFKADLWRYCILYLRGGFYVDVKFTPAESFEGLCTSQHWVLDNSATFSGVNHGIYNGFMMTKPGNPLLLSIIQRLVQNVKKRYVGDTSLDITGPGLLGSVIARDACTLYWDLRRVVHLATHKPVLVEYEGYREDCASIGAIHYSLLWPDKVYPKRSNP